MTPDQAKDALVLNPKKFLATNLLVVFGSGLTVRPPGPTIFKLAWTDTALGHGTRLKFVEKTRDLWSAKISLDNNGGNPAKGTKFAAGEFVAYYIPMMQVRNCVSGYPPTDGSLCLLLTSQLSGCTFAFSSQNGQFMCTHLQPRQDTGITDEKQRQSLQQKEIVRALHTEYSQKGLKSPKMIQANVDYHPGSGEGCTVVGHFERGKWRIYLQRRKTEVYAKELYGVSKV